MRGELRLKRDEALKKAKKNTSASKDPLDPLAEELDFNKLERARLGKGWEEVPKRLRGPKHLREARAWLKRKNASPKTNRRAA